MIRFLYFLFLAALRQDRFIAIVERELATVRTHHLNAVQYKQWHERDDFDTSHSSCAAYAVAYGAMMPALTTLRICAAVTQFVPSLAELPIRSRSVLGEMTNRRTFRPGLMQVVGNHDLANWATVSADAPEPGSRMQTA